MYKENMANKNYNKSQKNNISVLLGLIICVILVACSIILEVVLIRDEALRATGEVSGWGGGGFAIIFEILPMLIVASIISRSCRKGAVGVAKTILDYLRPAYILIGGLVVIPIIGIIIIMSVSGK